MQGNLSGDLSMNGQISSNGTLQASLSSDIRITQYEGSYEITPNATEQTLSTAGKMLNLDLVIKAIPQNYGLITWNGAFITIS